MPMKTARRVYYEGRVQAVGFRLTTKHIASGYEVQGWVRNLPDGRVEMEAAGEEEELLAFLKAVQNGPLGGNIRKIEEEEIPCRPGQTGFAIL